MNNSLKLDKTFSQDLSSGALSYTTSYGRAFKLQQILFHASVGITETITITLDSAKGSDYDTILKVITLSAGQNASYDANKDLQAGDEIKIQCTNANTTGTIFGVVKSQEILK